jgi:hypothetical protein
LWAKVMERHASIRLLSHDDLLALFPEVVNYRQGILGVRPRD